jgi:predicted amidohydrolase YtcJ
MYTVSSICDPAVHSRLLTCPGIWVSQAVLDLLPKDIPDVPGGEVVREPGMGVFCDNAMDMVIDVYPKPGREKKRAFVASAMAKLNEVGLVGMHDAGVFPEHLDLYSEMVGSEDWTVRVYAMLECPQRNTFCPDEAARVAREDDFFRVGSVKLFAGEFKTHQSDHRDTNIVQTVLSAPGAAP